MLTADEQVALIAQAIGARPEEFAPFERDAQADELVKRFGLFVERTIYRAPAFDPQILLFRQWQEPFDGQPDGWRVTLDGAFVFCVGRQGTRNEAIVGAVCSLIYPDWDIITREFGNENCMRSGRDPRAVGALYRRCLHGARRAAG